MWVTESRRFVISFTCPTSRKTRPWKQRTLVFVRIHPRTSLPVSQNETAEPRRHLIQRVVISRCPTRHRVLGRLGPSCAELLKFIWHNASPPSIWRFAVRRLDRITLRLLRSGLDRLSVIDRDYDNCEGRSGIVTHSRQRARKLVVAKC